MTNIVILHGRICHDLELKTVKDNLAMVQFTLAVGRKDGKTADFISCTMFGQTAERFVKFMAKGSECMIVGSIHTDSYTDKDGKKIKTQNVNANAFDFCGNKSDNKINVGTVFEMEKSTNPPTTAFPDFMNITPGVDDEVPFGQ